jgi:hypothetical protein
MSRFFYWLTFGLLAALLFARPLFSQFTPISTTIPLTGHLGDPSSGVPPGMSVKFELYGCGANTPKIVGSFSLIKQNFTVTPDLNGLISGRIVPNDSISCGGVLATTRYNVTTLLDGIPQAPTACYFVQLSVGTFNLDTAIPCTSISPPVPPSPPVDGYFGNLTYTGVLSGGGAVFGSTVQAHEFLLDFTPNPCSTGQFMTGYHADFTVICSNPPPTGVITFNGRPGVVLPVAGDYTAAMVTNALDLSNASQQNLAGALKLPAIILGTNIGTTFSGDGQSIVVQADNGVIPIPPGHLTMWVTDTAGGGHGVGDSGLVASGVLTAVSIATANGISGTSSGGSHPALTINLGAITPTSVAPTGPGFPIMSGTSSNVDWVGEVTLTGGTGSYSFVSTPALTIRPECHIHDHTTPANDATNTFVVTASGITITSTGTSDVIGYTCFGRI